MTKIEMKKLHLYNSYFDINNFNLPYQDYNEYLEDLRCLVDSYVNALFSIKKCNSMQSVNYLGFRGLAITDFELNNALTSSMVEKRDVKVGRHIMRSLKFCWRQIENRVKMSKGNLKLPLEDFFESNSCNFVMKLAIILSLALEMDRKYERFFWYLQDDVTLKNPTIGFVHACASLTHDVAMKDVISLFDKKITMLVFDEITSYNMPCLLSKTLKMKKPATDFFIGTTDSSFVQSSICQLFSPLDEVDDIVVDKDISDQITAATKNILEDNSKNILEDNSKRDILHIYGPDGCGKMFHVKHLSKRLNKEIEFVDLKYILNYGTEKATVMLSDAYLCAFLRGAIICFYNVDFTTESSSSLEFILNDVFRFFSFIIILNENPKYIEDTSHTFSPTASFGINLPNMSNSVKLWERTSSQYSFDPDVNFRQLSNKFRYTAGQISDIFQNAKVSACAKNEPAITNELLIKACREYAIHNLDKRATLINCHYTFDDLVIDPEQKRILESACNYIKYKDVVFEDWGFSDKVPYGRGLSVLFYGPPGTGKTMGAQVMANELGLQLYKIDLSQVINKYIGETEKNLGDIFNEAKKSNAILLFDEADSLFGKRTDVKDSNDKNANNETSYLLQKIEEYEGVSVLTTNKFNNFDDAFRRRIKFTISFPLPDFEMRRTLWNNMFPKKSPLGDDFDDVFLAEKFELSGSNIKSIAILAAYMAVGENSKINMRHILTSLRYECQKIGKIISKQDLGIYGDLI